MPDHLQEAINHLDLYGYCVIEEGIPGDTAREMAHDFLTFHTQPAYQDFIHGDAYYQTLFGIMNLDDRVWTCAGHPDVVAIARHFLGPRMPRG